MSTQPEGFGAQGSSLPEPAALERIALTAAQAGAAIVAASHEVEPVAMKSTATDVVTATDMAAEHIICDALSEATPGARVLGEEAGAGILGSGPHGDFEWIVDPLDGTVNFTYGVPITAVSVAVAQRGRIVAGAVVDVGSGEAFSAHLGGGARCNGHPIRCATHKSLAMSLVATGFSYDAGLRAEHGALVATLVSRVRDIRVFGSAALNLCWLGAGRVDAYLERDTKPWDYAAGSLVAAEAGARVELPCPENGRLSLAAPPALFDDLAALLGV
jgi:myo-inositol-1(or 4)-monophosphatase